MNETDEWTGSTLYVSAEAVATQAAIKIARLRLRRVFNMWVPLLKGVKCTVISIQCGNSNMPHRKTLRNGTGRISCHQWDAPIDPNAPRPSMCRQGANI